MRTVLQPTDNSDDMNRKLIFLLLLFTLNIFQSEELKANSDYTNDTILVNKLHKELKKVIFSDPEASSIKIDSIILISKRINYKPGLYIAYNSMGIKYFMLGDNNAAIGAYLKALQNADSTKKEQALRLYSNNSLSYSVMRNSDSSLYYLQLVYEQSKKYHVEKWYNQSVLDLGNYYHNNSDYAKAATYLLEAENICANSTDSIFILKTYGALATFYQKLENFDKAYYYNMKSMELDELLSGINLLSANTSNLGELFLRVKENYDTAIYFYNKSVELSLPYKKAKNILKANINIGNVFIEKGDIDSAFYYYSKAYKDTLLQNIPYFQAAIFTNLGFYYFKKKKNTKAGKFLSDGLSISKELSLLPFQSNALKHLWKLEKENGNYKQALDYHVQYMDAEKLLQDEEAINELALIEYEKFLVGEKYKNDLLKVENSKQQAQLLVHRIVIGVAVLLLITLLVFLYLFSKKRKEIKTLNNDLKKNFAAITRVNKVLKNQESEMRDLLESKDKFVSILGHDLKNPFSGLLGLLEMMDSDWDEMEEAEKKESIGILYRTSVQTYQLLEDLLDWGKAQQGLIIAEPENVDIAYLLQEVIEIFKIQSDKKDIRIELDTPAKSMVYTDAKLSSQIFQNFLGNAIKYSHPGTDISIKVKAKPKGYEICFIDKGIGIPHDKVDTLFNFDSNFNRPGTNNEKSTGMGLILCKEYASILGAKIDVKSEEGKGSSFCLTINHAKV